MLQAEHLLGPHQLPDFMDARGWQRQELARLRSALERDEGAAPLILPGTPLGSTVHGSSQQVLLRPSAPPALLSSHNLSNFAAREGGSCGGMDACFSELCDGVSKWCVCPSVRTY